MPVDKNIVATVKEFLAHQKLFNAAAQSPAPYPAENFSGRGIVICGGGDVYFPCAWVCIRMLRRLGCQLPIELWYRGPREMNAHMIALMRPLGVACVDAYHVARETPARRLDSWELKSYAIVNSSFEEVLFLDADNVPAQNPEFLFDREEYLECGSIFWPDRWPGDSHEWLSREAWRLCGVPYRLEPEIESGQMLIHKRRCWHALQLTRCLNEYSEFFYRYFYGDKDTFHLAWRRASIPYYLAPHALVTLGDSDVIVQFDFEGSVLFQHRNGDKWSTVRQNHRIPGFENEAECFALLEELRVQWPGYVRKFPVEFDETERRGYAELCDVRWLEYAAEGSDATLIELSPDLSIGKGADLLKLKWMVETDKDGDLLLSIRSAKAPTCFLRRQDDGTWHGRCLVYDRGKVQLRPRASLQFQK